MSNDYPSFYASLLQERRDFHYPPFYHLIYVMLKHRYDNVVESAAQEYGSRLRQMFGQRVLGPDKPAVAKVKALNIRKIVLKLENGIDQNGVRTCLLQAKKQMMDEKRYGALQIYFDVDPL